MKIDQMIKELETIVERLEREDLSFDESMDLYNKGVEIYKELVVALKEAKIQIQDVYAKIQSLNGESEIEF
ncbi:MAG: exodeoxyribonuclease VII small subunit [Pseudothermotoga sp.]